MVIMSRSTLNVNYELCPSLTTHILKKSVTHMLIKDQLYPKLAQKKGKNRDILGDLEIYTTIRKINS